MPTLNLGILAHVDAGKTTLTERLLYDAGVIDALGSVDAGSTHTDFLPLERQRGITIKSAVVSFELGDTTVNLIDTPGHPDFIAEVERALAVLDGVVLVVSAVEGVQPQTRILMRALQRLRVPTIIFVNKTDRRGARHDEVLAELASRLGAQDLPTFFGSALTGAGVGALTAAIPRLLPPATHSDADALSAVVFKIDRGRAGERVCYVRIFGGRLEVRQRVDVAERGSAKVTRVEVFSHGATIRRDRAVAGQIAKVWGLSHLQVGDAIGDAPADPVQAQFGPPTLEAVVVPSDPADRGRLGAALRELADQDPLINVRYDDECHELSVWLYGEVQKEVIEATLASEYGVDVSFGDTSTVYVERPVGTGEALELLQDDWNPTSATIGFRVEPLPPGTGVEFCLDVDGRTIPTYIYKTADNFVASITEYVRMAFREGLRGWEVTDCLVTMTRCGYYIGDGPTKPTRPTARTTAADFKNLTPLVVMKALDGAGTVVCGPMMRVRVEAPAPDAGAVIAALTRLGGSAGGHTVDREDAVIEGMLPAGEVQAMRRALTQLTGGEGVVETAFAGYEPVHGRPPTRPRTTANPLNRKSYFLATFRHRPPRDYRS
ncbi:MAG: TetM/TetW/TetO/TetS family tetracycline resistance ribosomal protection protein [Actinobacteria bacterium]|nr:TetM/TetW/TetO/TetS family tetracycline resistance ribosomal protection protein [Actinomycetota bacterium]